MNCRSYKERQWKEPRLHNRSPFQYLQWFFAKAQLYPYKLFSLMGELLFVSWSHQRQFTLSEVILWIKNKLQKCLSDLIVKLFPSYLHSFLKQLSIIRIFLPPHWVQFWNSSPQSGRNMDELLVLYLINSVIIGVNVNNKLFIDLFSDLILNLRAPHRFEG